MSAILHIDRDAMDLKVEIYKDFLQVEMKHLEDPDWTLIELETEDVVKLMYHLLDYLARQA